MTNEKEWWMERPWITGAKIGDFTKNTFVAEDICNDVIRPIVAEAERRGERKAWEEAKMILVPHQQFAADHPYREVRKKLFKAVEDKLTSLKTS